MTEPSAVAVTRQLAQLLLAFFIALAMLLVGELLYWQLLPAAADDVSQYRHLFLYPEHLKPERQERQLFLLFVVTLLPIAWVSARASRSLLAIDIQTTTPHSRISRFLAGAALAFCLVEVLAFGNSRFPHWVMPRGLASPSLQLGYGCSLFCWMATVMARSHTVSIFRHWRPNHLRLTEYLLAALTLLLAGLNIHAFKLNQDFSNDVWLLTCTSLVAAALALRLPELLLLHRTKRPTAIQWPVRAIFFMPLGFAGLSYACITFLRLKNINLVTTDPFIWTVHFEAVFYSFSQVIGGKTILADLPSQYGLSAEMLKPVFSFIGLTV